MLASRLCFYIKAVSSGYMESQQRKKEWVDYARQEVLRQWRHFDEDALRNNFPRYTTPALVLPALLERQKIDLNGQKEHQQLIFVWEQSMDPEIQAHAHPERLSNGTLFISVENNTWLSEIVRFRRNDILKRLQACLGKDSIKKLSFKVC